MYLKRSFSPPLPFSTSDPPSIFRSHAPLPSRSALGQQITTKNIYLSDFSPNDFDEPLTPFFFFFFRRSRLEPAEVQGQK
jgi:hypothetical protein